MKRPSRSAWCTALVFALLGQLGTPAGAATPDPYELNVLLPLTGTNAFLGKTELETMKLIERLTNESGGIKGHPLKFVIQDDTSSPQVALQLANDLVAKKVPVIVGSSSAAICSAIAPILEKSGPVEYCFSPAIHPGPGSYVFSASVGTGDLSAILVRYFRERGWKNIALLTSTDATGQDFDRVIVAALALPENRDVHLVAHEHFNITDVSVSAQIAKIKGLSPQALITWTTGTPFGTVLRGIRDGGLDIPVAGANSNMSYLQLEQYADFLPSQLYFPGMRAMTPEGTGAGPIKDAQARYFAAFAADHFRPDFPNNISWDPTQIIVNALQAIGPAATADQIHAYIENLHSWAGINGIYDFRGGDQRGIGEAAVVIHQWDPVKKDFVVRSRPAGYLK
jgi:branched-chain amino acid transport system substrate-binding protein